MSKENKDILSKVGKEVGFKVPEGYFDSLADNIVKELPEPKLTPVTPVTRWQRVRPYVYMAAMFVGMWLMSKVFEGMGRNEQGMFSNEILAGFENENNIEYLLMSGDISEYDILTYGTDSITADSIFGNVPTEEVSEPMN